jgi:hypothetical protein
MVELVEIDENTFRGWNIGFRIILTSSIMEKIHTLGNDLSSGRQCMECLNALLRRLLPLEKTEWLEQALVARVLMTAKYTPIQDTDGVKSIRRLLDGRESSY